MQGLPQRMPQRSIKPQRTIRGIITPPGDKSISHRAIMLGSLASGVSRFSNFLMGEDCLSTIGAFRSLGVTIECGDDAVTVHGVGMQGLQKPSGALNLGNSGTTMRLVAGILAGQPFDTVLTGDQSLESRPMDRIIEPLSRMGALIRGNGERQCAPLTITGRPLHGMTFEEHKGSAQVKSSVLLAGLYAEGTTTVIETKPSRDHTERMLAMFGAPFEAAGTTLRMRQTAHLSARDMTIPGDCSSAAFFIVAALILEGSEIEVDGVGVNPRRTALVHVLRSMGADITMNTVSDQGEPIGRLVARSSRLRGITLDSALVPLMIDELPILMIAAACAEGETVIRGAAELRVKETDRIASMAEGLQTLGVAVRILDDGIIIRGCPRFRGGVSLHSYDDHRTAMSFTIASLRAEGENTIINPDCVAISYPGFFNELERLTE